MRRSNTERDARSCAHIGLSVAELTKDTVRNSPQGRGNHEHACLSFNWRSWSPECSIAEGTLRRLAGSRSELAGLQRTGSRRGSGRADSTAGKSEVPRDLQFEP